MGFNDAIITGGAGATLAFNTQYSVTYGGSTGVDTIVAAFNNATVGINGALIFGSGSDYINASQGAVTYIGSGSSNVTLGGASHLVGLNRGNLDASNSTGSIAVFAGSGSTDIVGGSGSDALVAGSGNSTLTPGSGATLLVVTAQIRTSRTLTVTNFDGSHDFVNLQGYSPGADAAAFASASVSGVNTTVTLTDGTHIVFQSPANLASFSFTKRSPWP